MFKVGDKLISNVNYLELIKDKIYTVVDVYDAPTYQGDNRIHPVYKLSLCYCKYHYNEGMFTSLKELRQQKLNKICSKSEIK